MREWAHNYARMGWSVIPIWWTNKGRCACGDARCNAPGKHPVIHRWSEFQKRIASPSEIDTWWQRWPLANIAVITGSVSNLVVIDIDNADSELNFNTLSSVTGRGGRHYFFKSGEERYKNAVGVMDGVDIRGEGGYVLVPPSIHASGNTYFWADIVEIADLPDDAKRIVTLKPKPNIAANNSDTVQEGGRNNAITSFIGKLARTGLLYSDLVDTALVWNAKHCSPPLSRQEVETVVDSVIRIHKQNHPEPEKVQPNASPTTAFGVKTFDDMIRAYGGMDEEWLIADWLPTKTCGLVVAPPGTFKTWMLLDLAIAVSTGSKFMGRYETHDSGPVLLVQQEDPFPMLVSRIASIMEVGEIEIDNDEYTVPLPPASPPIYWHCERSLNFDNKEAVRAFTEVVLDMQPKLIIIDPLYSMISMEDYGSGGAQSMLLFKKIRDKYGCSFIVAHHTTKKIDQGSRIRDSAWGSQFLNAWLETGWQIRASDTDNDTVLITRHFKHSEAKPTFTAKFNISPYSYSVVELTPDGMATQPTTSDDRRIMIAALINDGGVKSLRQLKDQTGMSVSALSDMLRKLGVKKDANGDYYIPS